MPDEAVDSESAFARAAELASQIAVTEPQAPVFEVAQHDGGVPERFEPDERAAQTESEDRSVPDAGAVDGFPMEMNATEASMSDGEPSVSTESDASASVSTESDASSSASTEGDASGSAMTEDDASPSASTEGDADPSASTDGDAHTALAVEAPPEPPASELDM